MSDLVQAIRSCKYLYLAELLEPADNELIVRLLEASSGAVVEDTAPSKEEDNDPVQKILAGSRPIEHYDGDRKFELFWGNYIGYSVINESYSNGEDDQPGNPGSLFMQFETSRYLDYLAKASIATSDYPGPFSHWAIYCLNHTIDVASESEPVIRLI